jgi:hypothetical protein
MTKGDLIRQLQSLKCTVRGHEDVREIGHLQVMLALAKAFDQSESHLLAEPSLATTGIGGKRTGPPDIVLIDPEVGVHVVEVKGVPLNDVLSVEGGGLMRIRYQHPNPKPKNWIDHARKKTFAIRAATCERFGDDVTIWFDAWLAFPRFTKAQWMDKFGGWGFTCDELLFADDLSLDSLAKRLKSTRLRNSAGPVQMFPLKQMQSVWHAFGDTSVIYWKPDERADRVVVEGSLGETFDEVANAPKRLTDDQRKLIESNWDEGPRLVRGVAGSGKTIVLAGHCARNLHRRLREAGVNRWQIASRAGGLF